MTLWTSGLQQDFAVLSEFIYHTVIAFHCIFRRERSISWRRKTLGVMHLSIARYPLWVVFLGPFLRTPHSHPLTSVTPTRHVRVYWPGCGTGYPLGHTAQRRETQDVTSGWLHGVTVLCWGSWPIRILSRAAMTGRTHRRWSCGTTQSLSLMWRNGVPSGGCLCGSSASPLWRTCGCLGWRLRWNAVDAVGTWRAYAANRPRTSWTLCFSTGRNTRVRLQHGTLLWTLRGDDAFGRYNVCGKLKFDPEFRFLPNQPNYSVHGSSSDSHSGTHLPRLLWNWISIIMFSRSVNRTLSRVGLIWSTIMHSVTLV